MRDAVTALEAALGELESAREGLPDDLRAELDTIIRQAREVLASLEGDATTTGDSSRAGAPG
ncbi:MAG: hypothetical protein ACRDKJ_02560 [Actinomycetota bacterium]